MQWSFGSILKIADACMKSYVLRKPRPATSSCDANDGAQCLSASLQCEERQRKIEAHARCHRSGIRAGQPRVNVGDLLH
jgi:hypothetical protein